MDYLKGERKPHMADPEKNNTTTTPETGSEPSESKVGRLNQALSFAENSVKEVQALLKGAASITDVYEGDLEKLREQLGKSDENNVRLRERISEQDANIVRLRSDNAHRGGKIERLEEEAATLRRAKANLEKTIRDGSKGRTGTFGKPS